MKADTEKLPDDFPHVELLRDSKITTYGKLRALEGDYKDVAGVGEAKGAEINVALSDANEEEDVESTPVPTQVLVAGTTFPFGGMSFTLTKDAEVTFEGAASEAKFAGALHVSGDENFRLNAPNLKKRYSPVHGGEVPFECERCGKVVPDALVQEQIDAFGRIGTPYCSAECARAADVEAKAAKKQK